MCDAKPSDLVTNILHKEKKINRNYYGHSRPDEFAKSKEHFFLVRFKFYILILSFPCKICFNIKKDLSVCKSFKNVFTFITLNLNAYNNPIDT